jgi:shikimate kinase
VLNEPPTAPAIALIGLSGAGKSSVARALAQRRNWPLRDTDALIEASSGRRIPQLFAAEGEEHFRTLESEALEAALADTPCVVATGGGIVLREANRVLLRARAYVVWLDAPTEALIARLRAHDEERPLLSGVDPARRLEALRLTRTPLYAATAHLRIDTADRSVEQICDAIDTAFGFVTR